MVINTPILLAGLACLGLLLSACTTTYRESDLADEPGCEVESPFDPRDEEL
jgi:hypothetical protein